MKENNHARKYYTTIFICDWVGNAGIDKCWTGSIKESQWCSLVPGLFTIWANCNILYCDIGFYSKEVRKAGLPAVNRLNAIGFELHIATNTKAKYNSVKGYWRCS